MQIMFVWSILNTDSIMGYFCMPKFCFHSEEHFFRKSSGKKL